MKISANLGFLFSEFKLPEAIHSAADAGFDAVECHWPYDVPAESVSAALAETGLKMLGLNTLRGKSGENGLSALPDRIDDARKEIDRAIAYAAAINTPNVHVMAGFAAGSAANAAFCSNLEYACSAAAPHAITVLIEPLNRHDAPDYFLSNTDQAQSIIETVDHPNLKLMFDLYHVQVNEGDVTRRLTSLFPMIGHVQFASVPDRGEPGRGELNIKSVLTKLRELGWSSPVGAEYKPRRNTLQSLDWLESFQAI